MHETNPPEYFQGINLKFNIPPRILSHANQSHSQKPTALHLLHELSSAHSGKFANQPQSHPILSMK